VIYAISEMAERAVQRYQGFTAQLVGQAEVVFRRGATDESLRSDAFHTALDAARAFVCAEQAQLNDDTQMIAIAAHERAMTDLEAKQRTIPDRFADFIFSAALYTARIIAAQVDRDVMAMAQHNQTNALRVDLYVRSGRHTPSSATAAVMIEDSQAPAFRFVDRAGRSFKSTKHMRDVYRQHLLNIYNEVYMDSVAEFGWDAVTITHPDPSYRWFGEQVRIVSADDDRPLYYDIKAEVFHPSSHATLTIKP
jgi:hypothetical protein